MALGHTCPGVRGSARGSALSTSSDLELQAVDKGLPSRQSIDTHTIAA